MTAALTQASQSVMQMNKARWSQMLNVSQEAMQKNQQLVVNTIQKQSEGEKIMSAGLGSRGGRIDISV